MTPTRLNSAEAPHRSPRCVYCRYDLTGLPEHAPCPECGFDRTCTAVRARDANDGGTSLTVAVSLMAIFVGIAVLALVLRPFISWLVGQIGTAALPWMSMANLAIIVVLVIYTPRLVRRYMLGDRIWIITPKHLVVQWKTHNDHREVLPWHSFRGVDLKIRRDRVQLVLLIPNWPRPVGMMYRIDADEEAARRFCDEARVRMESNRSRSERWREDGVPG
jgi:hypothetical protein